MAKLPRGLMPTTRPSVPRKHPLTIFTLVSTAIMGSPPFDSQCVADHVPDALLLNPPQSRFTLAINGISCVCPDVRVIRVSVGLVVSALLAMSAGAAEPARYAVI